jgi:Tfp pilus assembly PilM family ATPase/Tfp pilus assembly protein PilN
MTKKITSLYIDDTSIRLLVTHGTRIKKWADSPLEPDSVKNGVILKEAEVAAKVTQLFKILKVRAKNITVGVSGLHCLSRPIILPQLPEEMLDEAVRREARRALPVPLEQLYLSWQTIPAPPGKTQVFLVAIPCQAADAMYKMLHRAGFKSSVMDIKPLALARATREKTAIIVDAQSTEFDIVIMVDGVCQPVRTIPLPSEALPWQEKLPLITKDLNRTIEFYNTNNPEKPLATDTPIYVSGELANEPELHQSLTEKVGHPVLPMAPPLKCPAAGLDPSCYMVNMGLTLKEIPPEKESETPVANINVMPVPYRYKPVSLTNVIALPGAAIAIGLLAFLVLLIQSASADVASVRGQLQNTEQLLQQKLAQKQELTGKIAELENKIAEAEVSGNNFIASLHSIEKQSDGINSLEVTVNHLPDTISLTHISYVARTLTINGRTAGEEELLSYLRELDASGRFSGITITSLRKLESKEMDFTLVLSVRE